MTALDELYRATIAEIEGEKARAIENFRAKEEEIKASVDAAGKEFQLEKYHVEKEKAGAKADEELIDGEQIQIQRRAAPPSSPASARRGPIFRCRSNGRRAR